MRVMVIRTKHEGDSATLYSNSWLGTIVNLADSKGWDVVDLTERAATREMVEAWIQELQPQLIIGAGHGFASEFIGADGNPIFTAENVKILQNRTIFLLSCTVGSELGMKIAQAGGRFIGWQNPVYWTMDDSHNPETDFKATPIKEVTYVISDSLLNNESVVTAYNKALPVFDFWINEFHHLGMDEETMDYLYHNKRGLTYAILG